LVVHAGIPAASGEHQSQDKGQRREAGRLHRVGADLANATTGRSLNGLKLPQLRGVSNKKIAQSNPRLFKVPPSHHDSTRQRRRLAHVSLQWHSSPDAAALGASDDGVRRSLPRHEAQALIEAMHSRIGAAALQQHLVTIRRPSLRQRCPDHRRAMPASAKLRMGDHVLQETVAPASSQQVRRRHEQARRDHPRSLLRYIDIHAALFQRLSPQLLRSFQRSNGRAHLRCVEQLQKRR